MNKYTYRYNVISKLTGLEEPFTGIFHTKAQANEWHDQYGFKWEDKGYKLIFRKTRVKYETK